MWWRHFCSQQHSWDYPTIKEILKKFLSILSERDFWSSWYLHHNLLCWVDLPSFLPPYLLRSHNTVEQAPVGAWSNLLHLIWFPGRYPSLMIWAVPSQTMKAIILLSKSLNIPLVAFPLLGFLSSPPPSAKLVLKIFCCAKGIHRQALSEMWKPRACYNRQSKEVDLLMVQTSKISANLPWLLRSRSAPSPPPRRGNRAALLEQPLTSQCPECQAPPISIGF